LGRFDCYKRDEEGWSRLFSVILGVWIEIRGKSAGVVQLRNSNDVGGYIWWRDWMKYSPNLGFPFCLSKFEREPNLRQTTPLKNSTTQDTQLNNSCTLRSIYKASSSDCSARLVLRVYRFSL